MEEIIWVDELINEYADGRDQLKAMKGSLDKEIDELMQIKKDEMDGYTRSLLEDDMQDKRQINSMISDMTYSLDWMKKGRRPGNRRGVDRRSAYQRTAYVEMDIFPDFLEEKTDISREMKLKLIDVLLEFSDRQRECYLLHMSKGFSYAQIAEFLHVKRGTVQNHIVRAKRKLKEIV